MRLNFFFKLNLKLEVSHQRDKGNTHGKPAIKRSSGKQERQQNATNKTYYSGRRCICWPCFSTILMTLRGGDYDNINLDNEVQNGINDNSKATAFPNPRMRMATMTITISLSLSHLMMVQIRRWHKSANHSDSHGGSLKEGSIKYANQLTNLEGSSVAY